MKKMLPCIMLSLLLLTSTVLAAPLTDFEKGKSAIDVGVIRSDLNMGEPHWHPNLGKKSNLTGGITTGLSEKFAWQYKYQQADTPYPYLPLNNEVHELNIIYRLQPHVYAFAGMQRFTLSYAYPHAPAENKAVAQVGVTSVAKLCGKADGWATIAAGNNNYSYEVGVSYALSKQADFNLFYRHKQFKGLSFSTLFPHNFTLKTKGVGAGITVRI